MNNTQIESLRLITEYLDTVNGDGFLAEYIQLKNNIEPTISEYLEMQNKIYEEQRELVQKLIVNAKEFALLFQINIANGKDFGDELYLIDECLISYNIAEEVNEKLPDEYKVQIDSKMKDAILKITSKKWIIESREESKI